jgi:hypothetical protein
MRMGSSPPRTGSSMSANASAAPGQIEVLQVRDCRELCLLQPFWHFNCFSITLLQLKEENKRLTSLVETLQRQLQELSMSRRVTSTPHVHNTTLIYLNSRAGTASSSPSPTSSLTANHRSLPPSTPPANTRCRSTATWCRGNAPRSVSLPVCS